MQNKYFRRIVTAVSAVGFTLTIGASTAFAETINVCPTGEFKGVCGVSVSNLISNVIQAVFVIAILIALFFLIWGGINWIISQGNKEKVSAARNTLIAALIGLIVVFLAYFLLNLVIQLLFGNSVQNVLQNVTDNGIFNR